MRIRSFVPHLVAHAAFFVAFTLAYLSLFQKGHFKIQDDAPASSQRAIVYALSTHSLLGDGSATPNTLLSRIVLSCHIVVAWILTVTVLVNS